MVRTTLAGLRAHPGRLLATLLAVTLGVGFGCGTMIFGDTVKVSFFDQFAAAARNVDCVVLPAGQDASGNPGGSGDVAATLPVSTLDAVRRIPGVAAAQGRYTTAQPLLDRAGRLLRNGDRVGYAISAGTDPRLRQYEVVAGRAPAAAGEAAVDAKTAERSRFSLGEPVAMLDKSGHRHQLTLVGTFRLAASSVYSGFAVVALGDSDLVELARPAGYAEIVVRATPGTSPETLTKRVRSALGAGSGTAIGIRNPGGTDTPAKTPTPAAGTPPPRNTTATGGGTPTAPSTPTKTPETGKAAATGGSMPPRSTVTGGGAAAGPVAPARTPARGTGTPEGRKRAATGAGSKPVVLTGEQRRMDLAYQAIRDVDLLLFALSAFAVVALVVAAFVIFNTFTILVAQRIRELALLRCVGASRRQVFGSVLLESAVVGLAGGILGVAAGVGIAYGMFWGFGLVGLPLPFHPPVLKPAPFLAAAGVGVAVTVLSAAVPAARAMRVAPLAALRTDPNAGVRSVRGRALRLVLAGLAVLAGGAASGYGAANPEAGGGAGPGSAAELLVIGGGMVVFLGLLTAMPLFIGPFTALLGALPGRLFGMPVRLATANGRRNPARAAVTSATLMVGVGLMTVFSVLLASSTATFTAKLASELPVDYGLEAADAGPDSAVPAEVAGGLRDRPEFDLVITVREVAGRLGGRHASIGTLDRAGFGLLLPEAVTGTVDRLRPGTVVLAQDVAARAGKRVGDTVTVAVRGRTTAYRVVATVGGSPTLAEVLLDPDEYTRRYDGNGATIRSVLLRAAPGVRAGRSRAVVDRLVAEHPLLRVRSVADYREEMTDQVDGLLGFFAGLLGVTFLIALVGIANTLSLSIVERTRESAVQRALGLTRRQLRVTLLVEALLLACVGAVVGVAFGVLYGVLLAHASITNASLVLAVPVGRLATYVLLAAAAGALAAVLPANRAQRVSIVAAMAHE